MLDYLSDIKSSIDQLAEKIGAPGYLLPTYGKSMDAGQPFIKVDKSGLLYYLAEERGIEILRYIAKDKDDLLYHVFKDVTSSMAIKWELSNRIAGHDSRRLWFKDQERLLGILSESWKLKKIKEHDEILKNHPFDDFVH